MPHASDSTNFDAWPDSWQFTAADVPTGREFLQVFKPFLQHLAESGASNRTLRRHTDNLWLLGGELIRRAQHDDDLRRAPAQTLLEFTEYSEAPVLIRDDPRTQEELDMTFRALARFLRRSRRPRGRR